MVNNYTGPMLAIWGQFKHCGKEMNKGNIGKQHGDREQYNECQVNYLN